MRKNFLLRARRGFTLLEMMIVISLIGILAAVAVPSFVDVTNEAKIARIQADLSTIGSAVEIYNAKNGKYPSNISDLVSSSGTAGYLRSKPESPSGAGDYEIGANGEVTCTFNEVTYSSFGTKTESGSNGG